MSRELTLSDPGDGATIRQMSWEEARKRLEFWETVYDSAVRGGAPLHAKTLADQAIADRDECIEAEVVRHGLEHGPAPTWQDDADKALANHKKIEAIKIVREHNKHMKLKAAKEYVEARMASGRWAPTL